MDKYCKGCFLDFGGVFANHSIVLLILGSEEIIGFFSSQDSVLVKEIRVCTS